MLTRREAIERLSTAGVAAALLPGCAQGGGQQSQPQTTGAATKRLRVLATSDLHGMFVPWDYALDAEDPSGSLAKLSTAIRELRDDDTLLVDAGDIIQDNMADLFLEDEIHPMIACMNELGYEVGVTGNHEYNYGMDVTRHTVATFQGKMLVGNVVDERGDPVSDGYIILDKGGVRVGFIGMVTPLITSWDPANLEGCTVTNPLEETRKIVDRIRGDVDVLIGVMHMGLHNGYGIPGTGVRDLAQACPEFDLIVAAHEHQLVEGEEINGVLVVENKYHGQTMAVVDLTLERAAGGWRVAGRSSHPVELVSYDPDPAILKLMAPYDERAKSYAHEVIGTLVGGPLAPEGEFAAIPQAVVSDTPLIELINTVQLHYSGADVSAAACFSAKANAQPGPLRRCDVSRIYKYDNTLYTLEMTGSQFKKYLEQRAGYYRTLQDGDLSLSFDPDTLVYAYDMFQGVNYQINVAKEPGARVEGLSWPDGRPVEDADVFVLATNNYRATSWLLKPGAVFEQDDMPVLREADVCGNIGSVRELIVDYIENVLGGELRAECDDNWQLTGIAWDQGLHEQAVQLVADGTLSMDYDDRRLPAAPITEADVRAATTAAAS